MRASIIFDEDNYIVSLNEDEKGKYEVPDDIELLRINCYHLVDNELIFDEQKAKTQDKQEKTDLEIFDLTQKLNSTDYIMARMVEEIMTLNNPLTFIADIIKIFKAYATKYKDTLSNRKTWRERIEELRNNK